MATTPSVGGTVHTPSTPLHGAAYDSYEPYSPRYQTRASSRKLLRQANTPEPESRATVVQQSRLSTPPSRRQASSSLNPALSPPQTARRSPKRKVSGRNFTTSLASPEPPGTMEDFASAMPPMTGHGQSQIFSANTTIHEGMLPTPVKTPRKKQVANVQTAARALFQDQPQDLQDVAAIPRKPKKGRRYNGFSLESFTTEEDGTNSQIQIFTDSRDRVPEHDTNEDNPFVDHPGNGEGSSSKKNVGGSKRRKISGPRPADKDVEEAIRKDDGMIYVFRGRKIFRKFESDDEEEQLEIDPEDLGLLQHSGTAMDAGTLRRPLIRKNIKPTRLFQQQGQKRSQEIEREEEAVTDIEDACNKSQNQHASGSVTPHDDSSHRDSSSAARTSVQSFITKEHLEAESDGSAVASASGAKKASPFDSWKRVKKGSASQIGKGKKRALEVNADD